MLVAATLLAAAFPQDEPEMKVSLKQCVHLSLNHNESLEVARFGPWIENETLLGSYGIFDWTLFAEGSSRGSASAPTSILSPSRSTAQSYEMGIRRLFPSGLLAEVRASSSRNKNDLFFTSINPSWNDRIGLTLSMPLLRGTGEEINTLTLVTARLNREMAVDEFETALQESIFAVQTAYYELAFARESEAMADEGLANARQLARESRQRFDKGLIAKVQVTEADAQVAAEELNVHAARQAHLDAMDRLKRLVDPRLLSLDRDTRLVPVDGPMDFEGGAGFDERAETARGVERAVDTRADVRRARRAVHAQELIRRGAEDRLKPKLDVSVGAGYQGTSGNFHDASRELGDRDTYDYAFAFTFEIPLENRKAESDARAAELDRRRLDAARRDLEGRVLVEIREAARRIKTQERSLLSAREGARLAAERLAAEQSRFREGLTTTYFVNVAQTAQLQARVRELRARIDYSLAHLNFARVTGRLLTDLGIDVKSELGPRR